MSTRPNTYLRGKPRDYGNYSWDDYDEAMLKSANQRQCEAHIADLQREMGDRRWKQLNIPHENVPNTLHPCVSPNKSLTGSHF